MKKAVSILSCIMSLIMSAQTHDLLKHTGEKLTVNLIKQENNLVYFSMPNSYEVEKLSKYALASVTKKSNNEITLVSNKITFTDKNSYKQVVFLDQSQTIGLQKGENISAFLGVTKGQSDYDLTKMKKRRLQEKAARKASPFLVILTEGPDETKAVLYNY